MATRVHRPLKVVAFNVNGIGRQHYELSKQLWELHIDVALLSETHVKPHDMFYIPNYQLYWTDHFLGIKGRTATAFRNDIAHTHVALPPLVWEEVTRVCILIGSSKVLFAAVNKFTGHTWIDRDITELLSLWNKFLLVDDLNAKNSVGVVKFQTLQMKNYWNYLIKITFKFQHHNVLLIILLKEMVMSSTLCSVRMFNWQMSFIASDILKSDHLSVIFHVVDHVRAWDFSNYAEKVTDREQF